MHLLHRAEPLSHVDSVVETERKIGKAIRVHGCVQLNFQRAAGALQLEDDGGERTGGR